MDAQDDEQRLLRTVALQNANAILVARQRAEQELVRAKEALERKTQELAHSLAMMRATLEASTDGILVTGERGVVTDFNERFLTLWRLPREVVAAGRHRDIVQVIAGQVAEPRRFLERIDEIYASVPAETFDVIELSDGRVFERYSRTQVVNGRDVGRVWTLRDITAQRRAVDERSHLLDSERAARAEAERASAMKDEFLATLSHELRTPLNSILGWAQMLRLPTVRPGDLQRGLETIERNTRVQAQLIEDLLDMSRIAAGKVRIDVQPVMPAAVVETAIETVRAAADAKGIRLTSTLDPSAGPVAADPNRLQQVIWNLLSNAVKFTGKSGRVHVSLQRVNSHIEISVTDTGKGIPPAFLPHVFDRFRQADASSSRATGGLGLGLAIVKQLVELHGGSVRAASPGEEGGATFTVELPLMAVHAEAAGERVHPGAPGTAGAPFGRLDLAGITVLVVDDEADARELVARILAECGAEVLTASSAQEALATIERSRPHVLVSDIGMPAVDGYQLLRLVRELGLARGGGVPAVALTAFARSEDRTRALRAGYLVHVAKPVEPTELVATVGSVVGRTGDPLRE
jgi:signal transduction histidine kinase/ActR/RegA family two-component response regulator